MAGVQVDRTRARVGSLLEWVLAALCILILVAIGSNIAREFRSVSAVTPVIAHEAPLPDPPAAVPPRAVSVPMLLLPGGVELRVGDTADTLARTLAQAAEVAPRSVNRTSTGQRETRFYEWAGMRFVVVLQPLDHDVRVRVAAIYLQ